MTTDENLSDSTQQPLRLTTDGQGFKRLVKAGLVWLQHHQTAINALNVYPVPDGDTGTNMVLTMRSAWAEIQDSPERNVGKMAHQMAHGALMGARGNSGVILSQIWRGFARSLDKKDVYHAQGLAAACREAADTAYKGVVKPVEGTILTVARAVAEAATRSAEETDNLISVLERMVFAAHEAVVLTPSLLPVLKEAGVVDAGGQGLFIILEGMLRYMRGEAVTEDVHLSDSVDLSTKGMETFEEGYEYDVQFLIVGDDLDIDTIRQRITAMGECPLTVGDPTTVKVHVHVPDPGVPISYGASLGSLRDVVVENMQTQYQDFIAERDMPSTPSAPPQPSQDREGVDVVAVVAGDGLARVFQSLGAGGIVHGGQTMNPSTEDILNAIEKSPADQVIVLPNNSNIILAAEQSCKLSNKSASIVPTKFVPQGVAALLAFNYQGDLESNVNAMKDAMEEVETGEVTTATRTATIDGIDVTEGEVIGLHNGKLKVSGKNIQHTVQALLEEMDSPNDEDALNTTPDCEIITLYYGEDIDEDEANSLAEQLQDLWPKQEIEVIPGGQPHYHYILSME